MEVRWSTLAAEDLERIFRRIEKDNPSAARETVKAIYDGCQALSHFPHRGCASPLTVRPSLRSIGPRRLPASLQTRP